MSADRLECATDSTEKAAPEVTTKPILLAHWACPFVQRAWAALNHKGVDFQYVHVDLADKPSWFLSVSPLGKAPVITYKEDAGEVQAVHESLVLLDFVEEQYKGSPLLPPSPVERAHARILINRLDQRLIGAFTRLSYKAQEPSDSELAQAIGKELDTELDWLESELAAHGGPYITGKNFTNVDAAVAPWILRAPVLEFIRGYKMLVGRPKLAAYEKTLRSTPAISATLTGPDDMAASSNYDKELVARAKTRYKVHHFF